MLRKRRKLFHRAARLVDVRLHDIDRVSNSWLTLGHVSKMAPGVDSTTASPCHWLASHENV